MSSLAPALPQLRYPESIEEAIASIEALLQGEYTLSHRAVAELLLQGDAEMQEMVREREGERLAAIEAAIARAGAAYSRPLNYVLSVARQRRAEHIVADVVSHAQARRRGLSEWISWATIHPIAGIPVLLAVIYLGLYQFVGIFGAGTLVGLLEETLFGQYVNPWVTEQVQRLIPWTVLQELFVGQYGVITLGVTYAVALILPIVGTFFIFFSVVEDTGYLPRLALLLDRLFKAIGLNGRAVIPMVLGLGCGTMAVVVTRVLETKRERFIASFLLALAIPCSAQLGVVMAILSNRPYALLVWGGTVGVIFMTVGLLTTRLLPGDQASFYTEVPPLRLPNMANVFKKTYTRMKWYFLEVFPLFLWASVIIWVGQLIGLFQLLTRLLAPLMRLLGLPDQTAAAFLFGFFRRDYGAAGLYTLQQQGLLSGRQLVVSAVTLTLFLPCVAQFSILLKERGSKLTLAIVAFLFPFAFGVGYALNAALVALGTNL